MNEEGQIALHGCLCLLPLQSRDLITIGGVPQPPLQVTSACPNCHAQQPEAACSPSTVPLVVPPSAFLKVTGGSHGSQTADGAWHAAHTHLAGLEALHTQPNRKNTIPLVTKPEDLQGTAVVPCEQ